MKCGGYFVIVIKDKFVSISDELVQMFCEVNLGLWKPGNTSLFITAQRCFAPGTIHASIRYYMNRATAQGLAFVHRLAIRLTIFKRYGLYV